MSSRSRRRSSRRSSPREKPDALLPTMGGQTALNTAMQLARHRRAGEARRRADRRQGRGDRPRRGPAEIPRRDGRDRHREPAQRDRAHAGGGARGAGRGRPARGDPAELHPRRHRRRHRLQPARSSSRSSPPASTPRPPPRCWSRRACSAGRNTRWRWSATARTTASSSARSRTSIRWACTPATA